MKVLVVAEYYPRDNDPARGVWAHLQALAAAQAGAEIRVLVLHRPLPPLATLRGQNVRGAVREVRQRAATELDGLRVEYLQYLSPPRPWSYASWGAWAAPQLRRRLTTLRDEFPFELVHAHYAIPAGDAVRRAAPDAPLVISVHGHDVYGELAGRPTVRRALGHARLVLANTAGTARRSKDCGARRTRVIHLGSDVPPPRAQATADDDGTGSRLKLVTVANLVPRKRHKDVISALALLRRKLPQISYVVVGDGPERERLRVHARDLGVGGQVTFTGALPHAKAVAEARDATLFVLPSVDEAFGVSYVEAMAAGVPAIGCRGEDGPEEIASAGGGMSLVPANDPRALADTIARLLRDPQSLSLLSRAARVTVERKFTWPRCGTDTVAAYTEALAGRA
jgi:glycosyltransferase involved in cell wall biosynthesis